MPQCVRPLPSVLFLALSCVGEIHVGDSGYSLENILLSTFFFLVSILVCPEDSARVIRNGFSLDS